MKKLISIAILFLLMPFGAMAEEVPPAGGSDYTIEDPEGYGYGGSDYHYDSKEGEYRWEGSDHYCPEEGDCGQEGSDYHYNNPEDGVKKVRYGYPDGRGGIHYYPEEGKIKSSDKETGK